MKATDLMIGDLVLANKKPIHVTLATLQLIQEDDTFAKLLRPIQLTEEILEKNGWSKEQEGGLFTNEFGILIYPNKKLFELTKSWQRKYDRIQTIAVNIRYVHELQHALKLCKIEKEIVL